MGCLEPSLVSSLALLLRPTGTRPSSPPWLLEEGREVSPFPEPSLVLSPALLVRPSGTPPSLRPSSLTRGVRGVSLFPEQLAWCLGLRLRPSGISSSLLRLPLSGDKYQFTHCITELIELTTKYIFRYMIINLRGSFS